MSFCIPVSIYASRFHCQVSSQEKEENG
jgi:hypothetical protein